MSNWQVLRRANDKPITPNMQINHKTHSVDCWVDAPEEDPGRHYHVWESKTLVNHDRCEICGLVRIKNENVPQPEKA